ncbi:MAG: hypothetical protein ACTSR8_14660 [Promethearchaeota archaeon]
MFFDILGMPEARFIQIYIVQLLVGIMFAFIAYLILKRDKKRLNVIFSGFYLCNFAGIVINCIYAPLNDEVVVLWLNFATNFLFAFSPVFLIIFDLILLKSEKVMNRVKQNLILLVYGAALLGLIFFIIQPEPGVVINESTSWRPVYTLPFYLYLMVILIGMGLIPSMYFSYQIYKKFEDEVLKRKWIFFFIGVVLIYAFAIGTFSMNYLNVDSIRAIWALFSLLFSILGPLLIYYGVGKQLEK